MFELEIQTSSAAFRTPLEVPRISAGGGEEDAVRVEGLAPGAFDLQACAEGVVVRAAIEGVRLGEIPLPVGEPWLLQPGRSLRCEAATLTLHAPALPVVGDGTAAMARALLAADSCGLTLAPALTWLNGRDCGKRAELVGPVSSLGRGDDCTARIRDPLASRFHARIDLRDERCVLVDLDSRNGVKVNGQAVRGERVLNHGDLLNVGETFLSFAEPTSPFAPPAPAPEAPLAPAAPESAPPRLATGTFTRCLTRPARSAFELSALLGAAAAGGIGAALWLLAG